MSADKPQETAKPKRGKPFQPGNNANPNGRPKLAYSIADKTRGFLDAPDPDDREGRSRLEVMQSVAFKAACSGDMRAFQQLMDRAFGKPVETLKTPDLAVGVRERPALLASLLTYGSATSSSGGGTFRPEADSADN